jgi:hypothetical protein
MGQNVGRERLIEEGGGRREEEEGRGRKGVK